MPAFWSSLREGSWLDRPRRRRIAVVLALAYAVAWIRLLAGPGNLDPDGRPVGSDFSFFYGASSAVRGGATVASLFDVESFNAAIHPYTAGGRYVWFYPPSAMLLFWPVSLLPYLPALAAWIALGLAGFLAVVRAILPGREAMLGALLSPAVFVATIHGQNSLLLAALVGGGFVLLGRSPVLAGMLLGAATFKPHFVLLVPVALLAGRRWRALVAAGVAALGLALIATALFGADGWAAFLQAPTAARDVIDGQRVPYFKLASVLASVRLWGGQPALAWVVQAGFTVAAIGWVALLWAREADADAKVAGTLLAALLATPYLYDYDMPLLVVGLAFWVRAAVSKGWLPWEKTLVFALWALPLFARPVAQWTGGTIAPALLLAGTLRIEARVRNEARARYEARSRDGASASPG